MEEFITRLNAVFDRLQSKVLANFATLTQQITDAQAQITTLSGQITDLTAQVNAGAQTQADLEALTIKFEALAAQLDPQPASAP